MSEKIIDQKLQNPYFDALQLVKSDIKHTPSNVELET